MRAVAEILLLQAVSLCTAILRPAMLRQQHKHNPSPTPTLQCSLVSRSVGPGRRYGLEFRAPASSGSVVLKLNGSEQWSISWQQSCCSLTCLIHLDGLNRYICELRAFNLSSRSIQILLRRKRAEFRPSTSLPAGPAFDAPQT